MIILDKNDANENIQKGDILSLLSISNTVTRSKEYDNKIIGICDKVVDNKVYIIQQGEAIINVEGLIRLGDMICAGKCLGKGKSIKHYEDKSQFNIRTIGKVIELYNDYSIAKILLNIE